MLQGSGRYIGCWIHLTCRLNWNGGMGGKSELLRTVMLYHTLLRTKAELDQLKLGLTALGVLDAMSRYSTILEPYFVVGKQMALTTCNAII